MVFSPIIHYICIKIYFGPASYPLTDTRSCLVMILSGKSSGKPKYGCPFCSAKTPYTSDGQLYTLAGLLSLYEVKTLFFLNNENPVFMFNQIL